MFKAPARPRKGPKRRIWPLAWSSAWPRHRLTWQKIDIDIDIDLAARTRQSPPSTLANSRHRPIVFNACFFFIGNMWKFVFHYICSADIVLFCWWLTLLTPWPVFSSLPFSASTTNCQFGRESEQQDFVFGNFHLVHCTMGLPPFKNCNRDICPLAPLVWWDQYKISRFTVTPFILSWITTTFLKK